MKVKDILAAKGGDVIGIEPTANLEAAAKLLSKRRIGAVVIRGAGGALAGILSERDIVRAWPSRAPQALTHSGRSGDDAQGRHLQRERRLRQIMERMTADKFRHLPVVRDGR